MGSKPYFFLFFKFNVQHPIIASVMGNVLLWLTLWPLVRICWALKCLPTPFLFLTPLPLQSTRQCEVFSTFMITGTPEEYSRAIDVLRVFFAIFGRWAMWVSPHVGLWINCSHQMSQYRWEWECPWRDIFQCGSERKVWRSSQMSSTSRRAPTEIFLRWLSRAKGPLTVTRLYHSAQPVCEQ